MEDKFNNIDETLLLEDEIIVRYLKGKMTAEEEQEFMQELESKEELKSKAIATARLVKGMKEAGSAHDEELKSKIFSVSNNDIKHITMAAMGKEDYEEDDNEKAERDSSNMAAASTFSWRKATPWLSAAASVTLLICCGIYIFNRSYNAPPLKENINNSIDTTMYYRGNNSEIEIESRLAVLYENIDKGKNLDKTIHELSFYWNQATQETYNDYTDFAPEIGLNLAQGYLKKNANKKAKDVLKKLIDITPEGTAIGDKARELLKKVEEL